MRPVVAQYSSAGQVKHVAEEVAPTLDEYVPMGQGVMDKPPVQYDPPGQLVHWLCAVRPVVDEYEPAEQAAIDDPPAQ